MNKLELLRAAAPGSAVEVDAASTAAELVCTTVIVEPNGDRVAFGLVVTQNERGSLVVREDALARQLPAACPERHINRDGSFCIAYREDDKPETFARVADAAAWWANVRGFLVEQLAARALGRWPDGLAWAHGRGAFWQGEFEKLAAHLPAGIGQAARSGHWPAAATAGKVAVGRRQLCPCGSQKRVKNCVHERALRDLWRMHKAQEHAEAAYFAEWQGVACCGADAGCPLRSVGPSGALEGQVNATVALVP